MSGVRGLKSRAAPEAAGGEGGILAAVMERCSAPVVEVLPASEEQIFDCTHARHDPSHCLAPGLFRSLQRGERKRLKLDVVYEYGENERIEFKGPEPLGVDDLRVLQGLVAMAGPKGLLLAPKDAESGETGRQLRLLLEPKWAAMEADSLVVRSSYAQLAREIGYANDDDARHFKKCIERLWTVSIIAQQGKERQGYRMLSHYKSDDATGRILVLLNPRITEAVLGRRPYTRIELAEVRGLKSDTARLLHQRLCGWIDPGQSKNATIDTLNSYVWPDPASDVATRSRRMRVRRALLEIEAVGWGVSEYARGKYRLTRPSAAAPEKLAAAPG